LAHPAGATAQQSNTTDNAGFIPGGAEEEQSAVPDRPEPIPSKISLADTRVNELARGPAEFLDAFHSRAAGSTGVSSHVRLDTQEDVGSAGEPGGVRHRRPASGR
jgi:hypothetical protein